MVEDSSSVTKPVKSVFGAIRDGAKNLNKNLGKVPIKTIGKWSAIGAAACSAISLAGWGIFKSALMKKETKNSELA